jgi:hypothetical protein
VRHWLFVALIALGSQASDASPKQWAAMTRSERVATLRNITRSCRLPASALQLKGEELHMKPPTDAKYSSVDCMLKRIKPWPGTMKMGFVGNEAYSNEKK